MIKYPKKLRQQLDSFDAICKAERLRMILAFPKYGDSYKKKDLYSECIAEAVDLFGYLIMLKMKAKK